MKIYNEIVIDMNTGETIYEDSFEYDGDVALCCMIAGGETYDLQTETGRERRAEDQGYGSWDEMQGSEADAAADIEKKKREWGLESLSMDQFYDKDAEGNKVPKSEDQVLEIILKTKPYNKDVHKGQSENDYRNAVMKQIRDIMPKMVEADKKKAAFLEKDKIAALGAAGRFGEKRELGKEKAEDAYGLGVSAYGRDVEQIKEGYGLGARAAERSMGAAEETYALGQRQAERGLESGLGQLQAGAGQLGAQMRGAAGGGMGGGMRGAIGGQAAMAKGVQKTYDIATDAQTSLTGALGRAKGAYTDERTRLRGAQERGLEAQEDKYRQLGQEKGYAETEYGITGKEQQAKINAARLAEDKGIYDLEKGAEAEWEGAMGTFLGGFRGGGRVPSKETFSKILAKIPEAGGS